MQRRNPWSCFIIGEGTLPIRCAELLLRRGFKINGMVSSDATTKSWAKAKATPTIDTGDDVLGFIKQEPCDYLFSIVNSYLLPKAILGLPRKYAINYHNAPLPKYAGSHATTWALMGREKLFGVTWHVMSEFVDAGDIVKQCLIDIADDDTALTLNAKCYEAAIRSFAELIDDLACGRVVPRKQNLDERTFFPRNKRPPVGCVCSWNRCAYEIDAFVRALDFGAYSNPIGLPKLALGRDFIVVSKTEVLDSVSESSPGTVTGIEGESLRVSTASRDIALRKLLAMDGQPLSIPDVVTSFGLHEGYRLRQVDPESARRITELSTSICRHETFWVERLATLQPLALPYAAQKPSPMKRPRYAMVTVPIPKEVANHLVRGQPSWNLSDFLIAAFAVYLGRIGGAYRFDIEYRDANLQRDLAGLEALFAPRVPLRLEIDHARGFAEALCGVREQVELVKRHKTFARDLVARYPALRSIREPQRERFLPIAVEVLDNLDGYEATPGGEFTMVLPKYGTECRWVYDTEIFDKDSIERTVGHFTSLLQGIVTDPDRRIAELPLLTEKEHHQLLLEFNRSAAGFPEDRCMHQLLEAQVESQPDAVAVVFPLTGGDDDQQLTYRELNRRANQLAHHLRSLGVGPDVLVGICVERSLEMVIGLLGILKAGGAYVPLDPDYPKERLAFILQDTQVSVLLTQHKLLGQFPKVTGDGRPATDDGRERSPVVGPPSIICLDTDWELVARQREDNLFGKTTAENLAYVIYTSGSAGRPKGVMMTHRAVCNRLLWGQTVYPLRAADRVLQLASLSFDFSVWEVFAPLSAGAQLIMMPPAQHLDCAKVIKLIAKEGVTAAHFVPSTLEVFLQERGLEQCRSLRRVFCGGEALRVEQQERFFSHLDADLYNQYGPTEACIDATFWRCERGVDQQAVPIGRPIANTQIYLLDSQLQPLPVGVAGELYIGGVGLARGYLNQTALTAEKFIPNPFSDEPGARLYKSGDRARYLPNGDIEFLGRLDRQVKVRGFRIELGEIEAVLCQHPAVREAVVIAREESDNPKSETAKSEIPNPKSAIGNSKSLGTRLVAYMVANREHPPTTGELRRFLEAKLPHYMLPSAVVFLDALPLTPNGKVDPRGLPTPDHLRPELAAAYVPPKTDLERQLVEIWQETLGIEKVGLHDNFFDLGGHSLLLLQVQSRLGEFLNREISVIDMFRHPTISSLVNNLNHEHNEQPRFHGVHDRAQRQKEAFARKSATQ